MTGSDFLLIGAVVVALGILWCVAWLIRDAMSIWLSERKAKNKRSTENCIYGDQGKWK